MASSPPSRGRTRAIVDDSSSSGENSPQQKKQKRPFSPTSDAGTVIPEMEDDDTPPPPDAPFIRQSVGFNCSAPEVPTYQASIAPPKHNTHFLPGQEVSAPRPLPASRMSARPAAIERSRSSSLVERSAPHTNAELRRSVTPAAPLSASSHLRSTSGSTTPPSAAPTRTPRPVPPAPKWVAAPQIPASSSMDYVNRNQIMSPVAPTSSKNSLRQNPPATSPAPISVSAPLPSRTAPSAPPTSIASAARNPGSSSPRGNETHGQVAPTPAPNTQIKSRDRHKHLTPTSPFMNHNHDRNHNHKRKRGHANVSHSRPTILDASNLKSPAASASSRKHTHGALAEQARQMGTFRVKGYIKGADATQPGCEAPPLVGGFGPYYSLFRTTVSATPAAPAASSNSTSVSAPSRKGRSISPETESETDSAPPRAVTQDSPSPPGQNQAATKSQTGCDASKEVHVSSPQREDVMMSDLHDSGVPSPSSSRPFPQSDKVMSFRHSPSLTLQSLLLPEHIPNCTAPRDREEPRSRWFPDDTYQPAVSTHAHSQAGRASPTSLTHHKPGRASPPPHAHQQAGHISPAPRTHVQLDPVSLGAPQPALQQPQTEPDQVPLQSSKKTRMITILIVDGRSGQDDHQLAEVKVPLREADPPDDGFWANAKDVCNELQAGPSRIDGPARVYTLRGKYRQFFLRVSDQGEYECTQANLRVSSDRTLDVVVEMLPPAGSLPPPPKIPPELRPSNDRPSPSPPPSHYAPPKSAMYSRAVPPAGRRDANSGGADDDYEMDDDYEIGEAPSSAVTRTSATAVGSSRSSPTSYPETSFAQRPPLGQYRLSPAQHHSFPSAPPPATPPAPPPTIPPPTLPPPLPPQTLQYHHYQPPARTSDAANRERVLIQEHRERERGRASPVPGASNAAVDEALSKYVKEQIEADPQWQDFWRCKSAPETAPTMLWMFRYVHGKMHQLAGVQPYRTCNARVARIHVLRALCLDEDWDSACSETLALLELYGPQGKRKTDPRVTAIMNDNTIPRPNAKPIRRLLKMLKVIDEDWRTKHT